ncbi:Isochorismatase-like protein [Hyaloraphidium curvatum]|nr:Isochorismatase-like protein [Hyaloraphidium curvatum]
MSSRFRPSRATTALFCCDIQEKFAPHIHRFDLVVATAKKVVEAGKLLGIPLVVTEQNPKALGPTVADIDVSHAKLRLGKTLFSMCVPETQELLQQLGIKTVVLFGIESHVCVTQTALELLPSTDVIVLADGVSSMHPGEVSLALDRMKQAGAQVASSESVIFQLLGDAKDPQFKAVQGIVKESKDRTGQALDALVLGKS